MAIMKSFKIQSIIFLALSIAGACQVWGSDLQTQRNPLYPFQSSLFLQDDFVSGASASGSIGNLGWSTQNGTTSYQSSIANRPGILRRDTSAVINTIAALHLSPATPMLASMNHQMVWIARLNTNDANTTVRIGVQASVVGNPPNDGIYLEKLDADTNWFCVTRSGGVQTRTDSTIAVNTSFNTFSHSRNASSVIFSINNTAVCTHTTNIPTVVLGPNLQIVNSAAAAKTIDIDYAQFIITGLAR